MAEATAAKFAACLEVQYGLVGELRSLNDRLESVEARIARLTLDDTTNPPVDLRDAVEDDLSPLSMSLATIRPTSARSTPLTAYDI